MKNYPLKNRQKIPVTDEKNFIPYEKWIVCFSPSRKEKISATYREFVAQGFYEAYDVVMSYAEKQNIAVRWFKEKRNCGRIFSNHAVIKLESFCTYCNKRFNDEDPIPCHVLNCNSTFCSRSCMKDHTKLLHNGK